MLTFNNSFWGEKNNGFDVLYQNMKAGLISSRELEEFIKESCIVEESYMKLQTKLAKMATNYGNKGSFGPFWQVFKSLAERIYQAHLQLHTSWQEIMREVRKYTSEQQKKQREFKEQEGPTENSVQSLHQTLISLQKSKEFFHGRVHDYEKLRRDGGSQGNLEKAEAKMKKANEDYKSWLDKYGNVRTSFINQMTASCNRFQSCEEEHLRQMRGFIHQFLQAREKHLAALSNVQDYFKSSCEDLTIEKLLTTFITAKKTGQTKPGPIEFQEYDSSSLNNSQSLANIDSSFVSGILALPINRKKKNKNDPNDKRKQDTIPTPNHLVDDEGYSIKPEESPKKPTNSIPSSSDDSDTEVSNSGRTSKLMIEIKPVAMSTATASATTTSSVTKTSTTSITTNNNIDFLKDTANKLELKKKLTLQEISKFGDNLINFDQYQNDKEEEKISKAIKTNLTKQPSQPSIFENFGKNTSQGSSSLSSTPLPFSVSPGDTEQSDPSSPNLSFNPSLIPAPQRPNPRPSNVSLPSTALARPSGRNTPDTMRLISDQRVESMLNLGNIFNSSVFPSSTSSSSSSSSHPSLNSFPAHSHHPGLYSIPSRGPSPLTLAISDTIPIAVAFSETAHAFFKGSDFNLCQSRVYGTVVMSFPGGIMRIFLENPTPPVLSFQLLNCQKVDNFFPNKDLLLETPSSLPDSRSFQFHMGRLKDQLKKQSEENKAAKYFNLELIKYQLKVLKSSEAADSLPFKVTSFWKSEPHQGDLRVDYNYNGLPIKPSPFPLSNIHALLQVETEKPQDLVLESIPVGTWSKDTKRIVWKLEDISDVSENGSQGTIKAKLKFPSISSSSFLASPPVVLLNNLVSFQFICEKATLSGLDFSLVSNGYRVSMVKKRFCSGRYLSEVELVKDSLTTKNSKDLLFQPTSNHESSTSPKSPSPRIPNLKPPPKLTSP